MVNLHRLSEEFARLAAINSPPLHEHAIARYLVGRLENLGAEVLFDNAAEATGDRWRAGTAADRHSPLRSEHDQGY